jgi:hypothetical protein
VKWEVASRQVKAEWLAIDPANKFLGRRVGVLHPPLAKSLRDFAGLEIGPAEEALGRMIEKLAREGKSSRPGPAGTQDKGSSGPS